ncbi:MAG: MerR family transcriptional regulator [Stappiaceae bacterium]
MRIGELAKRTSISRDTIRFYEKKGLIASLSEPSPTNNYRDYPESTILTLDLIKEARAAGMTIADLTIFMEQLETLSGSEFDGETFLQQKIEEVERTIQNSKKFLETLKATKIALAAAAKTDAP